MLKALTGRNSRERVTMYITDDQLQHHGVLGQKWGVRRYRNADGSLTEAGKKRQAKQEAKLDKYRNKKIASAEKRMARSKNKYTKKYNESERNYFKKATYDELKAYRKENRNINRDMILTSMLGGAVLGVAMPGYGSTVASIAAVQYANQRSQALANRTTKKEYNKFVNDSANAMNNYLDATVRKNSK